MTKGLQFEIGRQEYVEGVGSRSDTVVWRLFLLMPLQGVMSEERPYRNNR